MMKIHHWLALAVLAAVLLPASAQAACDNVVTEEESSACLARDLVDSDKRINAVYKLLMGNLNEADRVSLRKEQRAWLKTRDRACDLDTKETDRQKWLQKILTDQNMTICVVRFTFGRVAELDAMLREHAAAAGSANLPAAPSSPVLAQNPAVALPAGLRAIDDGYGIRSQQTHRSGLWYYEIWIDTAGIARQGTLLMHSGYLVKNGPRGVMTSTTVRHTQQRAGPYYVGLAIDLNQGFVYVRHNGLWRGAPGSNGGVPVSMNRDYVASIAASTSLVDLIGADLVRVNLGERPFAYAMPDGYRPFMAR